MKLKMRILNMRIMMLANVVCVELTRKTEAHGKPEAANRIE